MQRRALVLTTMAFAMAGLVGCKEKTEAQKVAESIERDKRARSMKPVEPVVIDFKKNKEEYEKKKKQQQQQQKP